MIFIRFRDTGRHAEAKVRFDMPYTGQQTGR